MVDGVDRGGVVDEAAAVCRAAEPGEILVSERVGAPAGRRSRAEFAAHGVVEGREGPLPVLRLDWAPLPEEPVDLPMPDALHYPYAEYVGRDAELDQLGHAFERAVAGERQVAVVGGEPGIGKTALTAVLAQAVEAAGGAVLYGRCLDLSSPYQPFVDALGHYVQFAPRRELETHVAAYGGELARLIPALAHRIPEAPPPSTSDPDTERYLAFTAAAGLITEACGHRPVLLVLDDLHWADRATLALLRQLVTATLGVNRVLLSIPPGVTSLVGPNGSGKTTLTTAATTHLVQPSRGNISVLGLTPGNADRFFRQVGYCTQLFHSFPRRLTGWEFLLDSLLLHGMSESDAFRLAGRSHRARPPR